MSELVLVCRPRESYVSRPAWQRDETKRSNKSCNNHVGCFQPALFHSPSLFLFLRLSSSLLSSLFFFLFSLLLLSSLYPRQPSTASMRVRPTRLKLVLPINRVNCSQHPRNCATCALIYCTTLLWPCARPAIMNGGHKPRFTHRSAAKEETASPFSRFNDVPRWRLYAHDAFATCNFPGIIRVAEKRSPIRRRAIAVCLATEYTYLRS